MSASDPRDITYIIASLLTDATSEDGIVASGSAERLNSQNRFASLFAAQDNDHMEFSCPALSLVHDDPLNFNHENPKEAEKSAFQLLSRPMGFASASGSSDTEALAFKKLLEVRNILLMNINESFALLVDSRLRAHATFMARHGLSVAAKNCGEVGGLDQKLQTLLEIGNRVTNTRTEMEIEVIDTDQSEEMGNDASSAVSFQVSMELVIGSLAGAPNSLFSIRFEAPGSLDVFSSGKIVIMKLELGIHKLLSQMKNCAAQVVAEVINMTNLLYRLPGKSMHRRDSYIAMPPPQQGLSHSSSFPHRSGGQALISPDMSACSKAPEEVPHMMLEEDDISEASDLSPDQCASILDDVFGDVDIAVFSTSSNNNANNHRTLEEESTKVRPSKKARTCE